MFTMMIYFIHISHYLLIFGFSILIWFVASQLHTRASLFRIKSYSQIEAHNNQRLIDWLFYVLCRIGNVSVNVQPLTRTIVSRFFKVIIYWLFYNGLRYFFKWLPSTEKKIRRITFMLNYFVLTILKNFQSF